MAQNYLSYSTLMKLPEKFSAEERAQKISKCVLFWLELNKDDTEIFNLMLDDLESDTDEQRVAYLLTNAGIELDDEHNLWFRSDEYGNVDLAADLATMFLNEFEIDEPFILTYAFTCSSLRLDEFGGGGFKVVRGRKPVWVDAWTYLNSNCVAGGEK